MTAARAPSNTPLGGSPAEAGRAGHAPPPQAADLGGHVRRGPSHSTAEVSATRRDFNAHERALIAAGMAAEAEAHWHARRRGARPSPTGA